MISEIGGIHVAILGLTEDHTNKSENNQLGNDQESKVSGDNCAVHS